MRKMRSMMKFCVLGSGSSGNASLVQFEQTTILIDAGFSAKRLSERMEQVHVDPSSLDAILLTHEHGDHRMGLAQFTKKYKIRVHCTHHTGMTLREATPNATWSYFEKEQSFMIGEIIITPFGISHDAVDPVGFRIEAGDSTLGYLSDTGHVTDGMAEKLRELDCLFVESNYDPHLLEITPKRPWPLKQRIASRHGHLSNEQASALVTRIASPKLKQIVLGHLSGESNTETIASTTMSQTLIDIGLSTTTLHCSRQHEILPWINIAP
ncbi:MAG: MBL fold metallo-hydrolase [Akkermansia sp.]